MKYVFTWASSWGPEVQFFDSAIDLLAFASGFTRESRRAVLIVSPSEVRA